MATGNCLRYLKNKRDRHLPCAVQKETGDIFRFYCCSYFFLTRNDLGVMGVFFHKIVIKLTKYAPKLVTA